MLGRQAANSTGAANGRRDAVIGIAVAAAVVVPFALLLSSGSRQPSASSQHGRTAQQRAARAAVISALNATTGSGSFTVNYRFDGLIPATGTTTTTNPPCPTPAALETPTTASALQDGPCGGPSPDVAGLPIHGTATIDTQPYAIVAISDVPGLGQVTVRSNDSNLWELGGADYGLASSTTGAGSGSPLSNFAGLVMGTLGQREGALAMLSLAELDRLPQPRTARGGGGRSRREQHRRRGPGAGVPGLHHLAAASRTSGSE